MTKHSVIITTRNEGGRLQCTIDDVERRSAGVALEIIVIDDASDDGSTEFLGSGRYRGLPVRLVRNPTRRGLIFSRAQGADLATGEYITFLDAHCAVSPDWLGRLEARLERIDGRGIASPLIHPLEASSWTMDLKSGPAAACSVINPFLDFGWASPVLIEGNVCTCTVGGMAWTCRRDWYSHIGGLDRDMVGWGGENIDMPLRTWVAGGLCVVADDVRVGHLFRDGQNHGVTLFELAANKIRAAHTIFSKESFDRLLGNLLVFDDFREALARLHAAPGDLAGIKRRIEAIRKRTDRWLIDTFRLPVFEAPSLHTRQRQRRPVAREASTQDRRGERPFVQVVLSGRDPSRVEGRLQSLLRTSAYTNFDVLVCLPGPIQEATGTDGSERLPRVQRFWLSDSPPRGFPESLGAALAGADYFVLLDDRVHVRDEFWVEKFLLLFERHPDLVLACPATRRISSTGADAGSFYDVEWSWPSPGFRRVREGAPYAALPYQALSCPDTLLFVRRESFLELGGFDASLRLLEDRLLDFSIRAWLTGREVYCHPGVVVEREEPAGDDSRHEVVYPSAPCWYEYAQLLLAAKYFSNESRLDVCRERTTGGAALLNASRVARQRRRFLEGARFDDDWLFYKFGISDHPDDETIPGTAGPH